MRRFLQVAGLLLTASLFVGCMPKSTPPTQSQEPTRAPSPVTPAVPPKSDENPLLAARKGHKASPVSRGMENVPPDAPPKGVFQLVKYPSPAGDLAAYVSADPKDDQKHPAIIWITGGDCNSIGDVWSPAKADNDQTAAQYRQAGIVMMYPSLRGGNRNPGKREGFFGEVDDVLAARTFLAEQPFVDPKRIYLGGHSTGGTLALLVAETGADFRCIFSFGPVDEVDGYGPQYCPFDLRDVQAVKLRSPGFWLAGIRSRTLVLEGQDQGNVRSVMKMNGTNMAAVKNANVLFYGLAGGTHFNILAALNEYLAKQIVADTGPTCTIELPDRKAIGKYTPVCFNHVKK